MVKDSEKSVESSLVSLIVDDLLDGYLPGRSCTPNIFSGKDARIIYINGGNEDICKKVIERLDSEVDNKVVGDKPTEAYFDICLQSYVRKYKKY